MYTQFPPPDYFHDYNKDPDIKRDMEEVFKLILFLSISKLFFLQMRFNLEFNIKLFFFVNLKKKKPDFGFWYNFVI